MIYDSIQKVKEENTLDYVKAFTSFFYGNFYRKYEHYEKMSPKLKQSGQLFGTARGSVRYLYLHSAQVITDYLKPLCSDIYIYIYLPP